MVLGIFVETDRDVGGVGVFDEVSLFPIVISDFEENDEREHDTPIEIDDECFVAAL